MDPVPSPPTLRLPRWFQGYMYVVGIGGNVFFYIQAWTIFARRSAADVSLVAFCIAFWAVSSWFVYGLSLRNRVIIAANAVAMVGAALVIAGRLLYG